MLLHLLIRGRIFCRNGLRLCEWYLFCFLTILYRSLIFYGMISRIQPFTIDIMAKIRVFSGRISHTKAY